MLEEAVRPVPWAPWVAGGGRRAMLVVVVPLLAASAAAWMLLARSPVFMSLSWLAFLSSWLVMMVAMMLPAVAPVVGLYAHAAGRGVVAAVPFFIAGYLSVWALTGVPAYLVWRAVAAPLATGQPWTARLVGGTLIAAGVYELTPLKAACLRRCRSPLSFFLARKADLRRPTRALTAGTVHGRFCLGCCWVLMAVLAVLGGMQLGWALVLALVVSVEKLAPYGTQLVRFVAVAAGGTGLAVLAAPSLLVHLIRK